MVTVHCVDRSEPVDIYYQYSEYRVTVALFQFSAERPEKVRPVIQASESVHRDLLADRLEEWLVKGEVIITWVNSNILRVQRFFDFQDFPLVLPCMFPEV